MNDNIFTCAPSQNMENNSCISTRGLKELIKEYNENNEEDKQIFLINNTREEMIEKLTEKLKNKCNNNQKCWMTQKFVKNMKNKEIKKELYHSTFRPSGPRYKEGSKNGEWLSTSHINNILQQYEEKYKDFKFLGAHPVDFETLPNNYYSFIPNYFIEVNSPLLMVRTQTIIDNLDLFKEAGKTKLGLVINTDNHNGSGEHWIGLFFDIKKCKIYFNDSVGDEPPKEVKKFINRLIKYMKKIKRDIEYCYNDIQAQYGNSECGVYSCNFIIEMLINKFSFNEICQLKIPDKAMLKLRNKLFENP